jgi:hypothetical protein
MCWSLPTLAASPVGDDKRIWIALAVAVGATIYVMMRPKLRGKRDPLEKPSFTSLASQRAVERDMQNLLVELSEMARQITAQIDTRAAKLEALLGEADQKLQQLRALNDTRASATIETMELRQTSTPTIVPEPEDERHAAIYALADEGKDVAQIAAELSRPRGEIELILALRPGAVKS